jgi:hypothetical protein
MSTANYIINKFFKCLPIKRRKYLIISAGLLVLFIFLLNFVMCGTPNSDFPILSLLGEDQQTVIKECNSQGLSDYFATKQHVSIATKYVKTDFEFEFIGDMLIWFFFNDNDELNIVKFDYIISSEKQLLHQVRLISKKMGEPHVLETDKFDPNKFNLDFIWRQNGVRFFLSCHNPNNQDFNYSMSLTIRNSKKKDEE